jgi:viroplasmin and RNaseH domain-containing protein
MTWYVVYRGKQPGVYDSWARCNEQVAGYKKNSYKSFPCEEVVASYLEFMGSEDVHMDEKPGVKPTSIARMNQSHPKFPAFACYCCV